MSERIRPRHAVAIMFCIIALASTAQANGIIPFFVSAENDLVIELIPAGTGTEQLSANGTAKINLQNGQVVIELENASPDAQYAALFVSDTNVIELGRLATDDAGRGALQVNLASGVYLGIFELTRADLVQFLSTTSSFTIGTTTSTSTTETSQTVATTTPSETETALTQRTVIHIEPPSRSIVAGSLASFNINIQQHGTASIFLAAKDVPPHSVAIFTRTSGLADPEFHSKLTIVTSTNTPAATYGITVVVLVDMQEFEPQTQISLEIVAPSTITGQMGSTTVPVGTALFVTLDTDQHHYETNATVRLQGHVTDKSGSVVADANVAIQVDAPTGAEVAFLGNLTTDAAGIFHAGFALPVNTTGTYTAFASASKQGYVSAATRTTFVVASSSTPSVVVKAVYTGDSAGNPTTVFSAGQTVYVWVVVENVGATFQGVIWVQVRDPSGTPVQVLIRISSLNSGETIKDGFGFTLLWKPKPGLYDVNALVSDNLISQGGVFLASSDTQFAVTS